jgi:hypothetical protein
MTSSNSREPLRSIDGSWEVESSWEAEVTAAGTQWPLPHKEIEVICWWFLKFVVPSDDDAWHEHGAWLGRKSITSVTNNRDFMERRQG